MSRDTEPLAGNDRHTRWSGPSGSRRRPARGSAVRQVPRHECPAPLSSPDPRGLSPCVWGPQETTGPRVVQNQARSRASLSLRPPPLSSPTCSQKGDARRGLSRPGSLAVRMALAPPLTATPAQPPLCPRLAQHTQVPTSPAESTPRTSVPPGPHPGPGSRWGPAGALQAGTPGRGSWRPSAPRHAPGGPSPERGLGPRRPPPHTAPRLRRARPVPAEASPGCARGLPASGLARRQPPAPRAHPSGGGVHGRDVTRACGHPCPCQP